MLPPLAEELGCEFHGRQFIGPIILTQLYFCLSSQLFLSVVKCFQGHAGQCCPIVRRIFHVWKSPSQNSRFSGYHQIMTDEHCVERLMWRMCEREQLSCGVTTDFPFSHTLQLPLLLLRVLKEKEPKRKVWAENNGALKLQQTGEPLKHKRFPAGVGERAAEEEGVRCLVHQPIKHHLPVPWSNGNPQLEVGPFAQVVVADRDQAHHFHVKGHSWAHGDGGQLVGHLFTVYKYSTWEEERGCQRGFK